MIKEYSAFSKTLALLEPHHQIVLCHIHNTSWGNLTSLQRYSQCILQPQTTGPPGHSLGVGLTILKRFSRYILLPQPTATSHSLEKSYPSAEMQSMYSTTPPAWASNFMSSKSNLLVFLRQSINVNTLFIFYNFCEKR